MASEPDPPTHASLSPLPSQSFTTRYLTSLSPSRYSSSTFSSHRNSYTDASSTANEFEITSQAAPQQSLEDLDDIDGSISGDGEDDNSIADSAEVERVLDAIDDELAHTEGALSEWAAPTSTSIASSPYETTTSIMSSPNTFSTLSSLSSPAITSRGLGTFNIDRERRVLSTITERTEELLSSRRRSGNITSPLTSAFGGSRPNTMISSAAASSHEIFRRSLGEEVPPVPAIPAVYASPKVDKEDRPGSPERRSVPPGARRTEELIAFFEDKSSATEVTSPTAPGLPIRPSTAIPRDVRSPSPFTRGHGLGISSGLTLLSRPSSPTKSSFTAATRTDLISSAVPPSNEFSTLSSLPPTTSYSTSITASATTGSATARPLVAGSIASTTPSRTRSPLASVRNLVAAWKEKTPTKSIAPTARTITSTSSTASNGFFGLRRRTDRIPRAVLKDALPDLPKEADMDAPYDAEAPAQQDSSESDRPSRVGGGSTFRASVRRSTESGSRRSGTGSSSGNIPPPFDIAELGSYARGSQEPLRIGLLWYLNVHTSPPYRWQRCQAVLYPSMLLLSWIAPGGGRGVVTLDLVNCNEVRSVPGPGHPSARDDVGSIAAREMMEESERASHVSESLASVQAETFMDMLCPFQLLYSDGIERLAAESARERVRWVSAIWEALDRTLSTLPDPSQAQSLLRSPVGSIRTISSVSSTHSGSGSASTMFVPPLDSIPDLELPDIPEFISTRHTTSAAPTNIGTTLSTTRATDDYAISSRGYVGGRLGQRGVEIAPSRSSSIRRTTSLTDLDIEYQIPVSIASKRSSISTSNGSSRNSYNTAHSSISELSDSNAQNNSGIRGTTRRVQASAYYSLYGGSPRSSIYATPSSVLSPERPSTPRTMISSTGLGGRSSTLTPLRTASVSNSVTSGLETASVSTSPGLSRRGEVRRRTPRTRSRAVSGSTSLSGAQSSLDPSESDKENETEESGSLSTRLRTPSTSEKATDSHSDFEPPANGSSNGFSTSSNSRPPTPRSLEIETESTNDWDICNTNEWSSLESRSYTTTTFNSSTRSSTNIISTPRRTASAFSVDVGTDVFMGTVPAPVVVQSPAATHATYITARSPTPSTPTRSSRSYTTALTPSLSSESGIYQTASLIPSSSISGEYVTADSCLTEKLSTDYYTAESHFYPPVQSVSTPTETPSVSDITSVPKENELDIGSLYSPSEVPTIPSEASDASEAARIPLPSSTAPTLPEAPPFELSDKSVTLPSISSLTSPTTPEVTSTPMESLPSLSEPTPSSPSSPSSPSAEIDEPTSPDTIPSSMPSVSSTTTRTSSSLPSSAPILPLLSPKLSSGPRDTDFTYETSVLRASPSIQSYALLDPVDHSFDTSFLRPSSAAMSEPERREPMTPISEMETMETPTETTTTRPLSSFTVTLARSPSTISTLSSASLSSSMLDNASLLELPSPSTEPSLLPSLISSRPISPISTFLPPSPRTVTPPTPSISVSLSTPRFDVPSIHSMETIASEEPDTLRQDINNLLNFLRDLDLLRGDQHQELKNHLDHIEDELKSLGTRMKERELHRSIPSPMTIPSAHSPTRTRPVSIRSLTPIRSLPSPSLLSASSMSFLSSHYSDELSLMPSEEYPQDMVPRVPPSEPGDGPDGSSSSWSSPPSSSAPSLPPRSITPSSTASTITPSRMMEPSFPLDNLREMLEDLRERTTALWDGQISTNHMLDELRERRPPVQDNIETNNRLRRIENLLDHILQNVIPRPEPSSPSYETGSDTASAVRQFIDRLQSTRPIETRIHQPTPVRAPLPSFDADWAEFLSAPRVVAEPPIQGPPALVQLTRRAARPRRFGSLSPPVSPPPTRSQSVPLESVRFEDRPHPGRGRSRGPWIPPRVGGPRYRPTQPPSFVDSDVGGPTVPSRPEDGPDFDQRVRERRRRRHPDTTVDGFYNSRAQPETSVQDTRPLPPRPPERVLSAPPTVEPVPQPWYQPAPLPSGTVPPVIPPGAATFVPVLSGLAPGPQPPFEDMLQMLRQNSLAQSAAIEQQREIMRYMRSLNEWLEDDVHDRHNELRSIADRVDALHDLIQRQLPGASDLGEPRSGVLPHGPVIPPFPQFPGTPGATPFIPPGPAIIPGTPGFQPGFQPGLQPGFQPGFPPGFQQTSEPVIPRVIPGSRPSSRPFIPPHPLDDRPVIPSFQDLPIPGQPLSPFLYDQPRLGPDFNGQPLEPFVPPPLSPELLPPNFLPVPPPGQSGAIFVPPPPGPLPPPTIEVIRSRSPSSSGSSTRTQHVVVHHEGGPPPSVVRMDQSPAAAQPSILPPIQQVPSMQAAPPSFPGPVPVGPPIIVQPPAIPELPRSTSRSRRGTPPPSPQAPIIITDGRRSRDHSPERPIVIRTGPSVHRSRTPERDRRRSRSRSRSPVVIRTESSRSRPRTPIIVEQPLRRSRSPPVVIHSDTRHSRRGSRSPVVLHRRSRSRSRSPTQSILITESRRSRSRSPVYRGEGRHHDHGPTIVMQPQERSRSRSPGVVFAPSSHRSPERHIQVASTSHRRSPSPSRYVEDDSIRPSRSPIPIHVREPSPSYRAPTEVPIPSSRRTPTERIPSDRRDRSISPEFVPQVSRHPTIPGPSEHDRAIPVPPSPRPGPEYEEDRGTPPDAYGRQQLPAGQPVPLRRSPSVSPVIEARPIPARHASPPFIPPSQRGVSPSSFGRRASPTYVPLEQPTAIPSRPSQRVPEVSRYSPPISEEDRGLSVAEPFPATHMTPPDIASQIRAAPSDQPFIPLVPSQASRPLPDRPDQTIQRSLAATPSIPRSMPLEETTAGVRDVQPTAPLEPAPFTLPPGSRVAPIPLVPSGPGDLGFEADEDARQRRLAEHEEAWLEAARRAEEAEDRREESFRAHEDERDRIFRENEERRDQEAIERRDEIYRTLEEQPPLPTLPSLPVTVLTPSIPAEEDIPAETISIPETVPAPLPVTPPTIPLGVTKAQGPELATAAAVAEILDLLRNQREEMASERATADGERLRAQQEMETKCAQLNAEHGARVAELEAELARTREELDQERNARRTEDFDRFEQQRNEGLERDDAIRGQLSDITSIVQEQRDECARKKELMEERWADKLSRRVNKDLKKDALYDMVEKILQDREEEKAERNRLREVEAGRPTTEQLLEELRKHNDAQTELVNKLAADFTEASNRHHTETIETVKAATQDTVQYNVTGYLDEFSKALAGEIRILLGEVGRLHELKRTYQYELGALMKMKAKFGPGGEFDPDWKPPMEPPAPPAPPLVPVEESIPPPAKPAWRNVQQRPPRRSRRGAKEPEPVIVEEQQPPRAPSWSTWQPHPSFAPTPPPADSNPLLVPPQSQGLFGPRSPHGSVYGA